MLEFFWPVPEHRFDLRVHLYDSATMIDHHDCAWESFEEGARHFGKLNLAEVTSDFAKSDSSAILPFYRRDDHMVINTRSVFAHLPGLRLMATLEGRHLERMIRQ